MSSWQKAAQVSAHVCFLTFKYLGSSYPDIVLSIKVLSKHGMNGGNVFTSEVLQTIWMNDKGKNKRDIDIVTRRGKF